MENDNWTAKQFVEHQQRMREAAKNAGNSKYKNKWVVIDGIKFQSTAEGNAFVEYKRRKAAGEIKDFERQRRYKLIVNGIQVSSYRADFVVIHWDNSEQIVDVKSSFTRTLNDYIIRKKLMKALFGIDIYER